MTFLREDVNTLIFADAKVLFYSKRSSSCYLKNKSVPSFIFLQIIVINQFTLFKKNLLNKSTMVFKTNYS